LQEIFTMTDKTNKTIEYKAEDVFQDIEGDPDNVNMMIPPEVLEKMGWGEGTKMKVTAEDGVITITEIKDDE